MPDYREIAAQKARKYGLPTWYFLGQIGAESNFNPNAVSPAGATGIAQIMPGTAEAWGVDPRDPEAALDAAARNMAKYVKQFGLEGALRAYNAGPGAVEASKGYDETNNYVKKIMAGRRDEAPAGDEGVSANTPEVSSQRQNPFGLIASINQNQQGPYADTLNRGWDLLSQIWEKKYGGQGAPTSPSLAQTAASSSTGAGAGGGLGGLREAFYDPVGGWDAGKSIGAIGGHGTHAHFGGGPKTIARIIRQAQNKGLTVRENEAVDPVDPVHTKGSWHYRHGGRGGADISGSNLDDFFRDVLRKARWR